MKCPNCGEEMAEGTLYCEHCGEDIHIVPDFEPELESNLEETINGIVEELEEQPEKSGEQEESGGRTARQHRGWKLLIVIIVFVVLAASGMGVWVSLYNSVDYQVIRAMSYTEDGAYGKAVSCYMRALELKEGDMELQFKLAEVYLLNGNKTEYEYLLREIIGNKNASEEQLDRAYGKLIAIYRAGEDYQTINDLLLACNNENLLSTYQSYIARAPEFSIKEGYYTTIQPLKLTSFGTGKIYYTMDGTVPDENSSQYITPILLENGDYCIKAVFVNEYGIISEVAEGDYHIENNEIPAPDISVASGEYSYPVYIEVLDEDTEDIFYTTDGSDPTYSSSVYSGPIPMPLGKVVYKFARIVDGVTGDIAERIYQLELNTEYTPAEAVEDILQYYMDNGRVSDREGHFNESEDMYKFYYQYVVNINDISDFYVISVFQSSNGILTRTGTDYAVNVYTKEQFRLQQDNRGRYELTALE